MNETVEDLEKHLLSIGDLSRLSGIPTETLRNWERRYGKPSSIRPGSGHRRYPSAIVPHLRLIHRAVDLGIRASFAATASFDALEAAVLQAQTTRADGGNSTFQAACDSVLQRLLAQAAHWDARGIERTLRLSWARMGAMGFIEHLAVPFIEVAKEQCAAGASAKDGDDAHLHFACGQTAAFLAETWPSMISKCDNPRVVVSALEGDGNPLCIHLAALIFAMNELEVVCLGADVPAREIAAAASVSRAVLISIQVSPLSDVANWTVPLTTLRAAVPTSVPIAVGVGTGALPIDGIKRIETFRALDSLAETVASIHVNEPCRGRA